MFPNRLDYCISRRIAIDRYEHGNSKIQIERTNQTKPNQRCHICRQSMQSSRSLISSLESCDLRRKPLVSREEAALPLCMPTTPKPPSTSPHEDPTREMGSGGSQWREPRLVRTEEGERGRCQRREGEAAPATGQLVGLRVRGERWTRCAGAGDGDHQGRRRGVRVTKDWAQL